MTQDELNAARHAAAEREWIAYDLGDYQTEGQDGWVWIPPGNEFVRYVYVASDGNAPSKLALFRVHFVAGTANVAAAQASLDGSDMGRRGIGLSPGESQR